MRFARILEFLVGLVFILGAAMKALDVPGFAVGIRAYQIFYDPDILLVVAYATLAIETVFGGALIAGIRLRGLVHAMGILLLLFFSAMIAYAWAVHGLEDCGCFGGVITMGPGASLIKNAILIAMLAGAWGLSRRAVRPVPWMFPVPVRLLVVAASIVVVAGIAVLRQPSTSGSATGARNDAPPAPDGTPTSAQPAGEFTGIAINENGQSYDLSSGKYLVAILSATCEHCKASVPVLNELIASPDTPQIVGLMMGDDSDVEQFRLETTPMFPTQPIDKMLWVKLLGDADEPPRFVLVQDGVAIEHWNATVPPPDAFAESQTQAAPQGLS